jgi:thiamine-monophosphate kinase
MASEFALLDRVLPLLDPGPLAGLLVPNGDDAVVFAPTDAPLVLSVDSQVEDVHFARKFFPLDVIAGRAFAAAVSDLAAMGATPKGALVAVHLPASYTDSDQDVLFAGLARAAKRWGCPIVGGNVSRAPTLVLTTTVLGTTPRPLRRSGARPGDCVQVAGTLGAAALGLAAFLRGAEDEANRDAALEPFRRAFRDPEPKLAAGLLARGQATAAIDVSDGFVQDLGHLAKASGVTIALDPSLVDALAFPLRAGAAALGIDGRHAVLHGGEDYALVVTARELLPGFFPVGTVLAADDFPVGTVLLGEVPVEGEGYDHLLATAR